MSRTLWPLAALAMLAVIVSGCSNAPAGTGSSNSTAATHEKAMKFAECMRDNGVSEFPDPDASGALTIDGIINGSSLDPSTAAWKKAITLTGVDTDLIGLDMVAEELRPLGWILWDALHGAALTDVG